MTTRDDQKNRIPTDAELDALAEITADDVDDAMRSLKQRVPASTSAVDAVRNDRSGASGPIPDEQ